MAKERILIVEDDAIAEIDVKAALDRVGFAVAGVAATGEDAVRLAGEVSPDLVLMDVRLAGKMDGPEAATRIAERHDIPVVFLTVYADDATLRDVKASGPFACLLKPVDDRELKTAVEIALYKHGMEQELRKARDAAEAANEAKTSFLATISHELRTPLNGVLGMTELLLLSDIDDEHKENVQLIKDASSSLLGLLNQILDYSKLEARIRDVRESDFRVRDILEGLKSVNSRQRGDKELSLELLVRPEVPEWLVGDGDKVRRILATLVGNAVKFTSRGGITVRVEQCPRGVCPGRAARGKAYFLFSVSDTGVGIEPEKQASLFESFTQGENYMTRQQGGLGLGLAIAQRLVNILGGDIWVESEPGKGSAFYFTAQLGASSMAEMGPERPAEEPTLEALLRGLRVLIVEDDPINQRYLSRLLEFQGCESHVVEDGSKAIAALKRRPYDVVLMDVQMPGMDGFEATLEIRSGKHEGVNSKVPIIALTAYAMWGDEQRCLHAGMDAYLAKPVDVDTLISTMETTLKSRRNR
ncbi:hybrid sensor histidine kinase/response regulator [Salidesulfovibrio onnuriiensis]|uniref:hybrid sensor histidine kinase/response regulator n=1 Tax=Salidesulfovibrio onnuriiensis TaxID=2583823 RepID=UPI0011C98D53|nr:hybrid sensor histidine kinase/response regulator [Salidesulfovibrio onnuriiensis]